jgi:hypothetical protein
MTLKYRLVGIALMAVAVMALLFYPLLGFLMAVLD